MDCMIRLTALLLAMLLVSDMAKQPEWFRRLLVTMAATGVSTAVFGLSQKIFEAPLFFWEPDRFSRTSFAM